MASLQPLERNEIQSLSTSPSTVYKSPYQTPDTTITIQATDDSAMSSSLRRKDLQQIAKRILPLYFFLSATMVFSPLVMVLYLLLRLLLLIKHGHDYYIVTQLKLCIRFCLFTLIGMVALNFGIGQKIPYHGKDYFPEITKALSRLPAGLYFQVSGICFFSCFLPSIICFFIPYQIPLEHMRSRLYVREGLLEIIDCVLFWWIESKVAKYVPPLEDYKILGLQIQKWIKVSICVIIAYNVFALFCHFILWALRMLVPKTRKLVSGRTDTRISQLTVIENFTANKIYLVYCFNGMKHSITFILSSLVLLLTWVIYFGSHFNGTPRAKNVLEFVTWTFVSVLICSLLWLIKTCVLLSWEVNVVYKKLGSQIIKGGNQLYLLGIIGRRSHDIFKLRYKARRNQVSQDDKQVEVKEGKLSGTVREGHDDDEEENMKTPLRSNVTTQSLSNKRKPFNKQLTQVLTIFNYPMSLGDRSKSKQDDEDDWTEQEVSNSKSSNDKGGNQQGKHYNVMVKQDDEDDCTKQEVSNLKSSNDKGDNQGGKHYNVMMKLSTQVKERVKDELLFLQDNHIPTIDVIQQVAQYLLTARKTLLIETYTSDILHSFHKNRVFNENDIKQLIEGRNNEANGKMKNEWDYFRDQLDSEEFSPETIGAWMDRARTNCLFLANTLSSAEEVADCLDKIISLLLIAATFILWLLLTGMATTKALVLIASPIIAATYIFGDTSKALFQGIIFTYLVHPFDVGDVCIIDKKMMEVKTMGVWKTIFSKVDTQEEVIYANSQLATKDIIKDINNHNWNDFVEIDVTPLYKKEIIKLERKIRRYLNNNQQKFRSGHNFVAVSTTGDDIKISISFRHNVNPKKTTATASAECLKEKLKLRAKFVLHVLDILKKIKKERSKLELNKRRKFQWQLNKPSQSN